MVDTYLIHWCSMNLDVLRYGWLITAILGQAGILWNRTVVIVVDKLSSTSIDFIRSERELKKLHLYGF